MQPQEWLSANETRSYPLRFGKEALPPDNWVLDALFIVSDKKLPLVLTSYTITPGTVSFIIKDSLGEFVGVFTYQGDSQIDMTISANGCSGKLVVNGSQIDEEISETYEVIRTEVNRQFEIRTTKLLPIFKIPKVILPDGTEVASNLILEDDLFLKYEVQEVDSFTDKIVVNSLTEFVPKCNLEVPLLSINGVKPDGDRILKIRSNNLGLEPLVTSDETIEIRSKYDFEDFQPNRRLGPRGLAGVIGNQGFGGGDGAEVCPSQCDTPETPRFTGIKFNNNEQKSLFSDVVNFRNLTRVSFFNVNFICALKDGVDNAAFATLAFNDFPSSFDWYILNTGVGNIHNDIFHRNDTIIVVGNGGIIQQFTLFGDQLGLLSFPNTDNILRGDSNANNGRIVVATDQREVFEFNGSSFNNLGVPQVAEITNVRYIDNRIFVCYQDGKGFDATNGRFYDFGISSSINDAYGEWLVANDGQVIRLDPNLVDFSIDTIAGTRDLKAIDGFGPNFVLAVGSQGAFLKFDGISWTAVPGTSTIKSWRDVAVGSINDSYIFGVE